MIYLFDIFEGIPGMFMHEILIFLNFVYVCQSFGWFTSLLKLFQYKDISSSGLDIFLNFLRHSWDVGTLVPNNLEFLICQSVCYLAYHCTVIRPSLGYNQFYMKYFLISFRGIPTMYIQ